MKRRRFLALLPLLPVPLALSCSETGRMTDGGAVLETQDRLFEDYNAGASDTIAPFLDDDFTFVDGNVVGEGLLFTKRLARLTRYHAGRGMLPLAVTKRDVSVVGAIAWVVCEVTVAPVQHRYGWLTQIFRYRDDRWKLVRHHFSTAIDV